MTLDSIANQQAHIELKYVLDLVMENICLQKCMVIILLMESVYVMYLKFMEDRDWWIYHSIKKDAHTKIGTKTPVASRADLMIFTIN